MPDPTIDIPRPPAAANRAGAWKPRSAVLQSALPALCGRQAVLAERSDRVSGLRADRAALAAWEGEGGHVTPS